MSCATFIPLVFERGDLPTRLDQGATDDIKMGRVFEPCRIERAVLGKPVPGFEHEPPGAVFAIGPDLVFLQHAEGLARVVRPHHVLRIELR
jgi:hypothetical protein